MDVSCSHTRPRTASAEQMSPPRSRGTAQSCRRTRRWGRRRRGRRHDCGGKGHRQLHWTKDVLRGVCREPLWAVSGASGGLGRAKRRGKRGGFARCARRGPRMRGCGRAVARTHRANEECGSGFGVRGQCFLHVSLATPNVLALHGLAWEKRSRGRHTERRRDTEGVSGIGRRTAGKQQRSPAREE